MKLMSIAGARPNFMKLASIANAVALHNQEGAKTTETNQLIQHIIVHTGQHYDHKMSESFFEELSIPKPDINLEVGSGSHAVQTAEIMKRFEPVLLKEKPDILLVVGDVNSTIACTLVASKIEYPATSHEPPARRRPLIVHVEAGLRAFDRDMPEEVNRILTDAISDLLFTTEEECFTHLMNEGIAREKIHFVGNVMIDTLRQHLARADTSTIRQQLDIQSQYGLVTLHRPSNVDQIEELHPLVNCLHKISKLLPLVFPVHPRTKNSMLKFDLWQAMEDNPDITLVKPLGYLDFLHLTKNASMVLTDSGGIQEETTYLKIPCVTLRENTERPITVSLGTNYLIGTAPEKILQTVTDILQNKGKHGKIPPLWDGNAGARIVEVLLKKFI